MVNVYESLNVDKFKNCPKVFQNIISKYKNKQYIKSIKVAACNGLVLNDPDIDAFTNFIGQLG